MEFGQIFADPGEKGETGGVEHSMGDDGGPNGAVQNHDDAEQKAEDPGEADAQKALGKVTEAEKNSGDENGKELAGA